ncbi:MAG: prefoldin subunit alpha [archaeon]
MTNVQESQAILQRAMSLRQQSEDVEKQLQFVSEQIAELQQFSENLDVLKESKEKEMLADIGRGVRMKVTRSDDEKLFVEVGAGIVVRKTPDEAKKIVDGQVKKFQEAKMQLTSQLQEHAEEFRKMLSEVEKIRQD